MMLFAMRCPVAPGDLLLPLGNQKNLVFVPNVYAGRLAFQGFRDLGAQVLFLEHSLDAPQDGAC